MSEGAKISKQESFSRKYYTTEHRLNKEPNYGYRMATEEGLKYIGRGSEVVAVQEPGNGKFITAFSLDRVDPEKAKEVFYAQQILATLFPYNFPRFKNS